MKPLAASKSARNRRGEKQITPRIIASGIAKPARVCHALAKNDIGIRRRAARRSLADARRKMSAA